MFYIEISDLGDEVTCTIGRGQFYCTDILIAEGADLQDLLDNATVSTIDQDGGSGPVVSMQDLPKSLIAFYSMLLETKFNSLQDKLQANQE